MQDNDYISLIAELKETILKSRYNAARMANRELLLLYYSTGLKLQERANKAGWGSKILATISADLQKEFPGLKGFSEQNLRKMRLFYQTYTDLQAYLIRSTASSKLAAPGKNSLTGAAGLSHAVFLDTFTALGFSHHYLLLSTVKDPAARWFYMQKSVQNQWAYRVLEHHIETDLYNRQGKLPNNFPDTLPPALHKHAVEAFKDEYLLDFIDINPDSERDLERGIVANIKEFILGLGTGFSFIGNQHRLLVGEQEFYIDLLFFCRPLQSLIAVELKRESFKPEHAGQLGFYLSVLDDKVKLPHENPSIGIILCKEKDNTVVEYAFKPINKPMGVATYNMTTKVPKDMKNILPDPDDLAKLL